MVVVVVEVEVVEGKVEVVEGKVDGAWVVVVVVVVVVEVVGVGDGTGTGLDSDTDSTVVGSSSLKGSVETGLLSSLATSCEATCCTYEDLIPFSASKVKTRLLSWMVPRTGIIFLKTKP